MTVAELLEAHGFDPQEVLALDVGTVQTRTRNCAEAHLVDGFLNVELSLSPYNRRAGSPEPERPAPDATGP